MRSRFVVQAVSLALISTLSLTGCTWWHNHFGSKKSGQKDGTEPPPLGTSDLKSSDTRPPITGDLVTGQFGAVYFDYDSAKIKPSEFSKLETVAAALKGNTKKMIIEGHCDERGTAEYNRALGERRAQAARESLASLGIAATRLSTISYGKDRPVEMTHDDTAWSRNRRCEFVIVSQ